MAIFCVVETSSYVHAVLDNCYMCACTQQSLSKLEVNWQGDSNSVVHVYVHVCAFMWYTSPMYMYLHWIGIVLLWIVPVTTFRLPLCAAQARQLLPMQDLTSPICTCSLLMCSIDMYLYPLQLLCESTCTCMYDNLYPLHQVHDYYHTYNKYMCSCT